MNISERQYGFQPGKSTIQPLFCLHIMLQEKHLEFGKELHIVCGPGKGLRQGTNGANLYSLRRKDVPEAYVNIIRVMYAGCKTSFMTSAGRTKQIEIEVGLHQAQHLVDCCS